MQGVPGPKVQANNITLKYQKAVALKRTDLPQLPPAGR